MIGRMRLVLTALLSLSLTTPLLANEPLAEQVAALTKDFKGNVVLYAKNLKDGKEFARVVRPTDTQTIQSALAT